MSSLSLASKPPLTDSASWLGEAEAALPHSSLRRLAVLSLLTILLGFGGLGGWASIASVESAVPATGQIVSGGKRKTVTLAENGILRELLVREGDRVTAGQVLLRLDDAQMRATRSQANALYWSARARAARLATESADGRQLAFPAELLAAAAGDRDVAAAVEAETNQFRNRWSALDSSVLVQRRKIAQSEAQVGAIRAQIAANGTRLSLLQEESQSTDYLMSKGLATRPRQLELRRNVAETQGQIGMLAEQMIQAQQAIAQTELEIISAVETRRSDISRERAETQAAQADAEQRLASANDLLQKREIAAPEAGTVTDIKFFTPGSSITAGQQIMDLVPGSSELLVEGNVPPVEVEHLAVGQRVNVRLTAFKAHRVPVITGRLIYVGADRQVDASNQPFFLIRAAIDPDALRDKPGIVLLPGMPADVLVINGARSVLDFLLSPILDSLRHAMKEE
jgi:HlyD family secretion protein